MIPVDVLEVLAGWCNEKNIGRSEWGRRSRVRAAVAELIEAHKRLLASHADYTESQARGWPVNRRGYPDYEWSVEIEKDARAALSNIGHAS